MKISQRSRLALLALLLALCTLFSACDLPINLETPAETSAQVTTAQTDSTGTTPADSTPADSDPAESTPEDSTPADSDPAESTPEDSTPADSNPAESTPEDSTPADSNPAESTPEDNDDSIPPTDATDPEDVTTSDNKDEDTTPEDTPNNETTPDVTTPEQSEPSDELEMPALSMPSFDISSIPEYTKDIYVTLNGNKPFFTSNQITNQSYEYYSNLDSLGRCGITVACIGRDLMPTQDRGDISSVKPTGWVQAQYGGSYLYNRSHLIGFQLTGENANEKNLITGTAYFNVGGMLPFENMVADYIKETGNHVLYRVTPVFVGNELVARGVIMEAWSVEDNGDKYNGICFNVFVYNVQPGVEIDYATGKSTEKVVDPGDGAVMDFVLNKSTKKFHLPTCTYALSMSESNKQFFHTTLAEMLGLNYTPCKVCQPDKAAA